MPLISPNPMPAAPFVLTMVVVPTADSALVPCPNAANVWIVLPNLRPARK